MSVMTTLDAAWRTRSGSAAAAAPAAPPRHVDAAPATPHLEVVDRDRVRRAADRRRRQRLLVFVTATISVAALFGLITSHVVLSQNQFRLERLEREAAAEQVRFDQLRLQVAELESPERIVASAYDLGMVVPPVVHYLSPVGTPSASAPPSSTTSSSAGATGSTVRDGDVPTDAAQPAATGWSTVKPHLSTQP